MNEKDFEGSLILESLAEQGLEEEFLEAIDSDNIPKVISLLRKADISEDDIEVVLQKLEEGSV